MRHKIRQLLKRNTVKQIVGLFLLLVMLASCREHSVSSAFSVAATGREPASSQLLMTQSIQQDPSVVPGSYRWQNVAISGMGFVTGVVIHPREPGLIYVRTDVGGIYRWDGDGASWVQLMDGSGYYSIESMALDPNNPNLIYVATGEGKILKSVDQGKTWTTSSLKTSTGAPVRMDGNAEWRWAGERLAVDPNNSQIVYFGSRLDGLYRSQDGGGSWSQVTSFPTKGINGGIAFVVFERVSEDSNNALTKQSQVLYAGVMGSGIFRSSDGGNVWSLLTDGPDSSQNPQQAVVAADGTLYATFFTSPSNPQGSVWKYRSGQWIAITPEPGKNYSAIAGEPGNPNTVIVATYPLTPDGLYLTTDAGSHWQAVDLKVEAVSWWPKWHLYTLTGGVAINPHQPKQVWLTTGFGVMRTEDVTARPSTWYTYMNNLEELVVFVMKSPPIADGAPLLSGVADMDGFRHSSLTAIPNQTYDNSKFGDTTGLDFSEANPNIVVRVGSSPGGGGREDSQFRSAYSSDNGRSWQQFANPPAGAVNGKVAVSSKLQANGYPILVWAPQGEVNPHRSLDGGNTWLPVQGAPNHTTDQLWFTNQAIASDRVDGDLFYLYKYTGTPDLGSFYRSTDGGATWNQTATGLPDYWLHSVKAAPGIRGEVWLSVQGDPLYRSSNAGTSFIELANVQKANEFTFGKAAPGRQNPTVFVYGTVNHTEGLFRSDDATSLPGNAAEATWIKVSTDSHQLSNVNYLEGDRLTFGRIYVGTGGRGILYGQPTNN